MEGRSASKTNLLLRNICLDILAMGGDIQLPPFSAMLQDTIVLWCTAWAIFVGGINVERANQHRGGDF